MVEGKTLLVLLLCAPCQCLAPALQPGLLRAGVDSATSACVAPAVLFQSSLSSAGQAEGRMNPFGPGVPAPRNDEASIAYLGIVFKTRTQHVITNSFSW